MMWKATIYKPYSKDSVNPYAVEHIEADDKNSAMAKAKVRVMTRVRTDREWQDAKIISIKEEKQ